MGFRQNKQEISGLLLAEDFERSLEKICALGLKKAVSPLIAFLNSRKELQRWRAVTGLGVVVARLADQDLEAARVVVRRLMWSLNDESGGIGWGAPEAMGEICARRQRLAREYSKILVSYLNPAGNYLEHPVLQRGLLWGLARLAHARPELAREAVLYIQPFLYSKDPIHRGLAAWILAGLQDLWAEPCLNLLRQDNSRITLYWGYILKDCSVARLTEKKQNPEDPC
ncbi:MAG: HEAT repeat domain-containing protein [Desulfohalobiaceae bacterium]|nr:HEAT repeat domain-containing protein [Desulfohalobiaceae bacterium]